MRLRILVGIIMVAALVSGVVLSGCKGAATSTVKGTNISMEINGLSSEIELPHNLERATFALG